jgi:AcrR family transcriptional regulator
MLAGRDRKREETRRRVYEAALQIFRRDGVAACRIDDIAQAAGVSRGTFYFHFPTKDDVLIERIRETEAHITQELSALPVEAPLSAVLDRLAEVMAEIWEADPKLLPDIAGAALRFTATTLSDVESDSVRATLGARFRDAAARGEVRSLLPPESLSDLFLGHLLCGMLAWYGNPFQPLHIVLKSVTALFWCGAGAVADR